MANVWSRHQNLPVMELRYWFDQSMPGRMASNQSVLRYWRLGWKWVLMSMYLEALPGLLTPAWDGAFA